MLEDRQQPRTQVEGFDLDNHFHIEVYDQEYALNQIHDVSISGTGIQIPSEIEPGTPVKLVYQTADYSISVNGVAVWCNLIPLGNESSSPIPSYRTGIQFDPSDRSCALLFHALKDLMGNDDDSQAAFDAL